MSEYSPRPYLFSWINQSVETLIAKYLEYDNRLRMFKAEPPAALHEEERQQILAFCDNKLREARAAIFPSNFLGLRKVFMAWQLLHRVSEELILLMDRDELEAYGQRLKIELAMSPMPEANKAEWQGKMNATLQRLEQITPPLDDRAFRRRAAQEFKNIAKAVNDSIDDRFWDLWVQKFIALIYAALLALAGGRFFSCHYAQLTQPCAEFAPASILLLGAMGGLASGILSGERESLPKSHFLTPILYYASVRPLIGAVGAMAFFLALQSGFFVKLNPPLPEGPCPPGLSSPVSPPAASPSPAPTGSNATDDALSLTTVTLHTQEGKQQYLVMLLLLFAGFSGDKLLKTVADRVTMRLIAEAEKTKEAK